MKTADGGLKAHLEHGIALNLVRDRHPDEIEAAFPDRQLESTHEGDGQGAPDRGASAGTR